MGGVSWSSLFYVKTYEIYSICELAIREELAAFYYKKSILLGRAGGWGGVGGRDGPCSADIATEQTAATSTLSSQ